MNNQGRQHRYLALPIALTLSALCLFRKETQKGIYVRPFLLALQLSLIPWLCLALAFGCCLIG